MSDVLSPSAEPATGLKAILARQREAFLRDSDPNRLIPHAPVPGFAFA